MSISEKIKDFLAHICRIVYKLHKKAMRKEILLVVVPKSVFGVLTSYRHRAIISTYYLYSARCNMAYIASFISVAILCTILALVPVVGYCSNSAESCAMPCKTKAFF